MADEDDNVESKSSSRGIISDILSNFTLAGSSNSDTEDSESNDAEQTDSQTESEKNSTDVESEGSTADDGPVERRQSSLERITDFFSSFSSSDSTDDSSTESKTVDGDESVQQIQEFSSDSADRNTSEADNRDIAENSAIEERRQSSLEKISDFLSSFTSLGTSTETTSDNNNQTDSEDNTSKAQVQESENHENKDVIVEEDDSEVTIGEGRLRSSSSRIFTEPESIDKKDLDYVTLVSS